ncbi:MAG TPA: hypothetical protein VGL91_10010 [Acidobacteriota bacterium]|jgi:hypothetical protein
MSSLGRVREQLERYGALLLSDTKLPSVSSLVAGSPVRGSWWGHPRSHEIFRVTSQLADLKEVVTTKLISGKVTFVHKQLWPALLAVATSREPWQMRHLSSSARSLLAEINKEGHVRTDHFSRRPAVSSKALPDAARQLERRLLVHAEEFHTESGAHARILESWNHWSQEVKLGKLKISAAEAKQEFEEIVASLNSHFHADAHLPWSLARHRRQEGRRQKAGGRR